MEQLPTPPTRRPAVRRLAAAVAFLALAGGTTGCEPEQHNKSASGNKKAAASSKGCITGARFHIPNGVHTGKLTAYGINLLEATDAVLINGENFPRKNFVVKSVCADTTPSLLYNAMSLAAGESETKRMIVRCAVVALNNGVLSDIGRIPRNYRTIRAGKKLPGYHGDLAQTCAAKVEEALKANETPLNFPFPKDSEKWGFFLSGAETAGGFYAADNNPVAP
ncbi:MAG TPA: hypothetical protein VJ836_06950 [Candidatus Saccharimonadales bacterium]|nr:hypothetical protein [Candidatus Saccharimonadales bacterium]